MQIKNLNKHGASIVEILAILAISSIIFVSVSSLLRFNVRQNAIAQEKLVNSAIATATLNYVQSIEFTDVKQLVYGELPEYTSEAAYTIMDHTVCSNLYFDNEDALDNCLISLNPTINNKSYGTKIKILVIPYNREASIRSVIDAGIPQIETSTILGKHLEKIHKEVLDLNTVPNDHILRVIVVVESTINDNFDYLIEGVITHE